MMFDQSKCFWPHLIHLSFVKGTHCSGEELCNLSVYLNGHALLLLTLVVTVRAPSETASLCSAAFDFYICECVNVNILEGTCVSDWVLLGKYSLYDPILPFSLLTNSSVQNIETDF